MKSESMTYGIDAKRVGTAENAADVGVQGEQSVCSEGFVPEW